MMKEKIEEREPKLEKDIDPGVYKVHFSVYLMFWGLLSCEEGKGINGCGKNIT